ncbi:MAG: GNAT family protein [Saprospiraceae bacterium]|nr:GNAT family protein [Saprospiraceae bacterium]
MSIFHFEDDITLENDYVCMRALEAADLEHFIPFAIHEPELWKYSLVQASGKENMQRYVDFAISKRQEKDSYPFIVFDKKKNRYAGSTRFYDYQEKHNTVQLGYTWYGADFQGTHVNRNCKYLLLEFAFEHLKVERVEFRADYTNKKSIQAMKSIGCVEEGVLRSNCAAHKNGRRDSIILSILKDEWFSTVKSNLIANLKKYE